MSDSDSTEQKPEDFQFPLPPASLGFLVLSLRTQAEMQLGLVHFGEGNLTLDEQRLLENSVTELRFRFVQVSEETAKAAAAKA